MDCLEIMIKQMYHTPTTNKLVSRIVTREILMDMDTIVNDDDDDGKRSVMTNDNSIFSHDLQCMNPCNVDDENNDDNPSHLVWVWFTVDN